jgi:UDP-N-acetylglucosamine diphosphorylase/glucosamine-1-phosphate N-acetyltransferase
MQLCIFEDDEYYKFEPLVFSRPVFELKLGISTFRKKIADLLQFESYTILCRDYLNGTFDYDERNVLFNQFVEDDYLFINSRIFPDYNIQNFLSPQFDRDTVFRNNEVILAIFLRKETVKKLFIDKEATFNRKYFDDLKTEKSDLKYFTYVWDLIYNNDFFIKQDFEFYFKQGSAPSNLNSSIRLVEEDLITISDSAKLGYNIVLDASNGPIIIDDFAQIKHNTVIEGPVYIGKNSLVKNNSQISSGTSVGDYCKVAGEISNSIILDFSNKQHDGFLGHSYLGSWVNLGAGTITSNLKNNYSKIQVELSFNTIKTDLQFLGLLSGDHSKSAIGTRFNTSTVVGFSCNIFGDGLTDKFIPSFSWGGNNTRNVYQLEKAIDVARAVYGRRGKEFRQSDREIFQIIFNNTAKTREKYGYK